MLSEAEKLEIAREAVASRHETNGFQSVSQDTLRGERDDSLAVQSALRALTLADQRRGGGDRPEIIRHRKGGEYEVLARGAQIQTDTPLTDYAKVDVYRSTKDGATWVRPVDEMHDGRFEVVGAPVLDPLPDQGGKP